MRDGNLDLTGDSDGRFVAINDNSSMASESPPSLITSSLSSLTVSRLIISSFLGFCCLCLGSSVSRMMGNGEVEGANVGKNGVGVVVKEDSSLDTKLSEIVGRNMDDELSSILTSSSSSEL